MKLYHGMLSYPSKYEVKRKIDIIQGSIQSISPILISTSSKISESLSWGGYGFILEVPEESVVVHSNSDCGTPTYIAKSYSEIASVLSFLIILGGFGGCSRIKSPGYDEVVVLSSRKNKVCGIWYRKNFSHQGERLKSILKDIMNRHIEKETFPPLKIDKRTDIAALGVLASSMFLYFVAEKAKGSIIVKNPQEDYEICFGECGKLVTGDPYGRPIKVRFRNIDSKVLFSDLKRELKERRSNILRRYEFQTEINSVTGREEVYVRNWDKRFALRLFEDKSENAIVILPSGKQSINSCKIVSHILTYCLLKGKDYPFEFEGEWRPWKHELKKVYS